MSCIIKSIRRLLGYKYVQCKYCEKRFYRVNNKDEENLPMYCSLNCILNEQAGYKVEFKTLYKH